MRYSVTLMLLVVTWAIMGWQMFVMHRARELMNEQREAINKCYGSLYKSEQQLNHDLKLFDRADRAVASADRSLQACSCK